MLDHHETIELNFFLEMASLSLTVADVRALDDSDGAGHGHLPPAAGDSCLCQPRLNTWLMPVLIKVCVAIIQGRTRRRTQAKTVMVPVRFLVNNNVISTNFIVETVGLVDLKSINGC